MACESCTSIVGVEGASSVGFMGLMLPDPPLDPPLPLVGKAMIQSDSSNDPSRREITASPISWAASSHSYPMVRFNVAKPGLNLEIVAAIASFWAGWTASNWGVTRPRDLRVRYALWYRLGPGTRFFCLGH